MPEVKWGIRREGRAWEGAEIEARHNLTPEKMELIQGKLFWTEAERVTMLALLLENVGVDPAVRLGSPEVWRQTIAQLDKLD